MPKISILYKAHPNFSFCIGTDKFNVETLKSMEVFHSIVEKRSSDNSNVLQNEGKKGYFRN